MLILLKIAIGSKYFSALWDGPRTLCGASFLCRIKFGRRPSQTAGSPPRPPSTASATLQHRSGTSIRINPASLAFCATREPLHGLIAPLDALEHAEPWAPSTATHELSFMACQGCMQYFNPPFVQRLRNCTCSSLLCGSRCLSATRRVGAPNGTSNVGERRWVKGRKEWREGEREQGGGGATAAFCRGREGDFDGYFAAVSGEERSGEDDESVVASGMDCACKLLRSFLFCVRCTLCNCIHNLYITMCVYITIFYTKNSTTKR